MIGTPSQDSDKPESDRPADSDALALRVRALFSARRRRAYPTRNDDISHQARATYDAFTLGSLARQLGTSRETLARLLGGLPIRAGSRALITRNLDLQKLDFSLSHQNAGQVPEADRPTAEPDNG